MAQRSKKVSAASRKNAPPSQVRPRADKIKRSARTGDLRDWLDKVDAIGELQPVLGADWNKEIGAISQINYRRPKIRRLLFDDIKDYPRGYRVLTSSMGSTRRLALAFRFSTDLDRRELIEAFRGKPLKWEKDSKNYRPRAVDSGPVFEEVHEGRDVNVRNFPRPSGTKKTAGAISALAARSSRAIRTRTGSISAPTER